MAMFREHLFELLCAAVVKEGIALAHAAKRRRIELTHSFFVAQTYIVGVGRSIEWRNVAVYAAQSLEQRIAAAELGLIGWIVCRRLQGRRRRQQLQKGRDLVQLLGRRVF